MMQFRTPLAPEPAAFAIQHQHQIMCIGSCFATHIGHRLLTYQFPTLLNPFGVLYSPLAIAYAMSRIDDKQKFTKEELHFYGDLWHSFAHHGSFSHPDLSIALENINHSLENAHRWLMQTDYLFITLGTAKTYFRNNIPVANCHKFPASEFTARRLKVPEIVETMCLTLEKAANINPAIQVIMTVSPVRHLRDGLVANQRSKAALLLAIEELAGMFPNVHYFPAYELMMDDLRDYRFYKNDWTHPNELAVNYIWEFFQKTFFNKNTLHICRKISAIKKAVQHRPFHPETASHQQFIQQQLKKIERMEQQFPFLDFSEDTRLFQQQIT